MFVIDIFNLVTYPPSLHDNFVQVDDDKEWVFLKNKNVYGRTVEFGD